MQSSYLLSRNVSWLLCLLSEVSSYSRCKVNFRLPRVMESANTVVQLWDIATYSKWKPRSILCHSIFRSADLCFSLGLIECMNGIIIFKKFQRALLRLRSMTFLLKLTVFEGRGDWKGTGERNGISHSNVSFVWNPSEIQWSISIALCFPRAVHGSFGQIKY